MKYSENKFHTNSTHKFTVKFVCPNAKFHTRIHKGEKPNSIVGGSQRLWNAPRSSQKAPKSSQTILWKPQGAFCRESLRASGSLPGSLWEPLVALLWKPFGASGSLPLGAFGNRWGLLGASGNLWQPSFGSLWWPLSGSLWEPSSASLGEWLKSLGEPSFKSLRKPSSRSFPLGTSGVLREPLGVIF